MSSPDSAVVAPTTYRIQQLGPPRDRDGAEVHVHGRGSQRNEAVTGFDSLVLHHPGDNRAARMEDGAVIAGEQGRLHGYIGGRLEEVEAPREVGGRFRDYGLKADQVLLKKDFILSHPDYDSSTRLGRRVEVPSPVAGVVGARRDREGLVDILDEPGGKVIARFRHMSGIRVHPGERVEYGQTLGIQDKVATKPIHVHMEMDTRYYLHFRNYVDDLATGRLPLEAEFRHGIQPRPAIHDGSFRLGESSLRIRDLQLVMDREGYRAAGGGPLDRDGVYRLGMQGALLDFQRLHGLPQTGDVDPATLRFAPPAPRREVDRPDYVERGRLPGVDPVPRTAPGHPDHPDHRPDLPDELEPAVNRRPGQALRSGDLQLDRLMAALDAGDGAAISRACADIARAPDMQLLLRQGRELLTASQAQERQQQPEAVRQAEMPMLSRV